MLLSVKHSATSVILRVKLLDSSVTTGAGLTGLTSASSGLIISTIVDNAATATAYTQAGSTIEDITTLGTYAAPTASKCRFKEVDSTNHKGIYEIHFADARFSVASARFLLVSLSGATNLAQCDFLIQLNSAADHPVDVRQWIGGTPNALQSGRVDGYLGASATGSITSSTFAGGAINADAIADSAIDAATFAAGAINAAAIANGAIDAATFAAGAIDAAALAADAGTEIAAAVLGSVVETEGTYTLKQAIDILLAVNAGRSTVSGATYTLKTPNGVADRGVFTLNASKERTAVTLTPSS